MRKPGPLLPYCCNVRTDILYRQCPKVKLTAAEFSLTYQQRKCPGYDTWTDLDSDFSTHIPPKEPSMPTVIDIIVPGDLTSTYNGHAHPTDLYMITRTADWLHVRATRPDITLLPPPVPMDNSNEDPASRSNNDDVKNTFRILIIVLLIVAVISIAIIRIVKQDRRRKKAAARAAEMEMAPQAAIQQQVSHSNEEQLPSYAEAIAADCHDRKSGEARRPLVVVVQEGRRAALPPDPADIGNFARPGGIFQPPDSGTANGEGSAGRPSILKD